MITTTTLANNPLSKNQDYVMNFETEDGRVEYIVCMDGHGNSRVIDQVRNGDIDLLDILSTKFDSAETELQNEIDRLDSLDVQACSTFIDKYQLQSEMMHSGSTISILRIERKKEEEEDGDEGGDGDGDGSGDGGELVFRNCGDSTMIAFVNDKLVYRSPDHTFDNEDEKIRLTMRPDRRKKGVSVLEHGKPFLLSPSEICMKPNHSFLFNGMSTRLVPTQTLGHLGLSGPLEPSVARISFTKADRVRVVMATDGLWDMILSESFDSENPRGDHELLRAGTVDELVECAAARWKQEWVFYPEWPTSTEVKESDTRMPEGDDVACAVFQNF